MKIKRKALSLLSCLALLVSSIPSTAVFVSADEATLTSPGAPQLVTIAGSDKVFANGTDIEVTYDDESSSNIVSWTDAEGAVQTLKSVPKTADVFAGCHGNNTPVGSDEDPVEIVINGAKLNTVYGGGLHESTVNNVKITVKGDSDLKWVCGGGANCLVRCNQEACNDKGWNENAAANSATLVKKAEINIEGGSVAEDVYGGGEGYSKSDSTTVNIKGGTITSVCAGGSNGVTGNSEVNIENGKITYLYSVNRGTMGSSAVTVKGGEIENLYVGSAGSEYPTITGTVNEASVNVEGGKVTNLKPGNSGNGVALDAQKFTDKNSKYSFSVSPKATVTTYDQALNSIKDTANSYYYFTVYTEDGTGTNDKSLAASKLTHIVQVLTGSDTKTYQFAYVMANGETVVATDVKDESGAWKATKFTCKDGSYVETNYDAIHLFGGKHNDDTLVESTDVTLDGTTHVQSVWGGGWHKSQTGTTKVTVKNDAEVKGIQGGAANFFEGTNCGTGGCEGYNGSNSSKKCFDKPSGKDASAYNVSPNARVDKAEVIVESCKPYTTPSGKEGQTLIYGGGECFAYTGECTVTIKGGEFNEDAWVIPAGSNGYTEKSTLIVDGNVTIPNVGSGKSGIVKDADIEVKSGTVTNLTVGMIESPQGYGEIEASNVTVEKGGIVGNVAFGKKSASGDIDADADNTFKVEANGGKIEKFGGVEIGYGSKDVVCKHDAYPRLQEVDEVPATCVPGKYAYWQCSNCKHYFATIGGELTDVTNDDADTLNEKAIVKAAVAEHQYVEHQVKKCDNTLSDYTYYTCSVCGQFFTDKQGTTITPDELKTAIEKASDHKNIKKRDGTKATCAKEGKTDGYYCEDCGITLVPQLKLDIDPTKHEDTTGKTTWSDWKKIDENSDKYGEYTPVTCTEDGWQYSECTQCGAEKYKEVVHEGHKPAEDIESNRQEWDKATCTEPGSYKLKCTVCGELLEEQHTEAALGHDPKKIAAKAPTCTEDGNILYWQCQRKGCGKLFSDANCETLTDADSIIDPKTGHKNTQEYPAVAPSCRQSGSKAYVYCKDCDCVISIDGKELEEPKPYSEVKDQIFVSSDPSAHAYSNLLAEAKAPTCTEDGSYAYFKCKYCENYYKIIDEKAKTYEKIEVVEGSEPTEEYVKIAALGHDYGDWKPIDEDSAKFGDYNPASCTQTGWEYQECKRCGHEDYRQVQATGHKYGDLIPQKDATCTEPGLAAHYQCSVCQKYFDADETEVEYDELIIPATGHKNIEFVESKDATCLTTGNKEHYKCSDCGQLFLETGTEEDYDATYEQPENILPDTGSYKNTTVKNSAKLEFIPNVSTVISKLAGATVINVTFTVTGVPAGGAKAYLPTVITGGSANWNPSDVCPLIDIPTDGTYTVSYNGPAVPADATFKYMGINIKKASSTSADQSVTSITLVSVTSSLTKTLYLNEATDADIVTPIKSHLDTEYNAKVATAYDDVAATCTDSGWSGGKYCSVCGKVLEARTFVPAKGHNYNQGEVTKEATCTSDGLKTFTCQNANCGSKYTEVIPATGHKYGEEGTVTKAATCTADGIKTFTCETCNNTYTEVIPATGHTEETITGKAATCSEYGLTDGTKCSVCNVILVPQTVLPKTAHTVVTDAAVEATCTKTGLTEGTHCSVCNAVITAQSVVSKKPHTPVVDEAVAATCTQSGKTKGSHCEVCGGIIEEQVVIPALGHEYVNGVCTVCNEKQPNYEPPTQPTAAGSKVSVKVIKITQAKITNLKVKSKAKNKINVSWKKVANAKGYQIEVSKSSSFKPGAKVLTKTTKKLKLTIKNKKLKSKKTYYVRARAYTTYKAADGSTKTAYSNWNYVLRKVKIK